MIKAQEGANRPSKINQENYLIWQDIAMRYFEIREILDIQLWRSKL